MDKLDLQREEVDTVISHGKCTDGFAAAYCAWKYAKENKKDIAFYSGIHGALPPVDVTGKCVLIVDFSFKKKIIIDMIKKAKKLLILDHHITAEEDLKDIDPKYKYFNMKHSGAYLSWEYFFPNKPVPLFIKYIEDTDIWANLLPNTQEFTCISYDLPFDFKVYDQMQDEKVVHKMIEDGKIIYPYIMNQMAKLSKHAKCYFQKIGDKYYFIVYLGCPLWKSQMANKLLTDYPFADFSVVYHYDDVDMQTRFSIRSSDDKTDLGIIAKVLGTGGHRNAIGHGCNGLNIHLPGEIQDNGTSYRNLSTVKTDHVTIKNSDSKEEYKLVYMLANALHKPMADYLLSDKYKDCDVAIICYCGAMGGETMFTLVFNCNNKKRDLFFTRIPAKPSKVENEYMYDQKGTATELLFE